MFQLLQSSKLESVKTNAIQCLHNIADLPLGFQQCVDILAADTPLLDTVFGAKAVKPLASLLPKLSSYTNPPNVPHEAQLQGVRLLTALWCLLEKYPEAVIEAIDTVNIAQKLAPFLNTELSKAASACLKLVCLKDAHNLAILKRFLQKYPETPVAHGLEEVLAEPRFD